MVKIPLQEKCSVAALVGIDATPDPGLRGPTNFAGTLRETDILELDAALTGLRCAPRHACQIWLRALAPCTEKGTRPPVVLIGTTVCSCCRAILCPLHPRALQHAYCNLDDIKAKGGSQFDGMVLQGRRLQPSAGGLWALSPAPDSRAGYKAVGRPRHAQQAARARQPAAGADSPQCQRLPQRSPARGLWAAAAPAP
jgi:hypothetical protein